jgi:hypothetical protein
MLLAPRHSSPKKEEETMAGTVDDTMHQVRLLSVEDQKEVAHRIRASLNDPDPTTTKNLWYIIVGTLAALAIGGLVAVAALSAGGKSTEVVAPLVTLAIGGLVGIVAPSPTQSTT